MYTLIDKDKLVFLAKHERVDTLSNLAWIQYPDAPVAIVPCTPLGLFAFTDLELRLLYKNSTDCSYAGYLRNALVQVVANLMVRLPETDCNAIEVRAQALSIAEDDEDTYRYVKGRTKPEEVTADLYPKPISVPRSEEVEIAIAQGKNLEFTEEPEVPFFDVTASSLTHTAPQPRIQKERTAASVVAPPRGSTRETIWSIADQMWEAAGKPINKQIILGLRKSMMDQLESQGVKRTSSSNELGNWQKVRCAA